jgi:hypothetical protein
VSRDSSVGTATGYGLNIRGSTLGAERDFFLSILALGPTHPPIQWVLWVLSPGVKLQGREADSCPPSSAGVKNGGAMPPLPRGAYLIKHRDNITLPFTFKPDNFLCNFIYLN